MREIKFRAWNTTSKSMGEPFTLQTAIGSRTVEGVETSEIVYMQYTGLKDRNGIELAEDDLFTSTLRGVGSLCQVSFRDGAFCGIDKNGKAILLHCWLPSTIEVIGNIHQTKQ